MTAESETDGLSGEAYLTVVLPGLIVAIVMYIIFLTMRPRYPDTYAPRTKKALPELESTSPVLSQGMFDWVGPFMKLSPTDTAHNVSTDAAAYLIFQMTMIKIFAVVAFLCSAILIPVYVTADGEETAFSKLTMANIVEERSTRYWGCAVMAWPVSAMVYYFIYSALSQVLLLKDAEERRVSPWRHYSVLVHGIPEDSRSPESVEKHLKEQFGDKVGMVQSVKEMGKQYEKDFANYLKSWRAWKTAEATYKAKPEKVPMTKDGFMGLLGKKVEAIPFHQGKTEEFRKKIDAKRAEYDSIKATRFAFVSFKTLGGAAEAIAKNTKGKWACTAVPHPRELFWSTLVAGKSDAANAGTKSGVIAATAVIIIMFIPFMAFAMALVNLDDLAKEYDFLDWVNDVPEGILGFIQGLLPVLVVVILNALVLPIFKFMATKTGIIDIKRQHLWVMWMYFWFLFLDSFVVNLGVSSLFNQLQVIIDKPESLADLLGSAVPRSSGFFLCFVTLYALAGAPGKMALIGPLLKGIVLGKMAKTDFAKEEALEPLPCLYGDELARMCFIFVICASYVVIAPLMSVIGFVYFLLQFVSDKYLHNYVFKTEFHGGGFLVVSAFQAVTFGVFVAQFVLFAVLLLEESPAAIVAAPLLFSIILVFVVVRYGPGAKIRQQELSPALVEYLTHELDEQDVWTKVEKMHEKKLWTQPSLAINPDEPLAKWFSMKDVDAPSALSPPPKEGAEEAVSKPADPGEVSNM
mmetsp:Transcript_11513/g.26695  ORF Transcript_11513/g.26695 Transcript_11513/m.26695 type:complete len:746 (-) Transcript_11513:70-2307(-)